MSPRKKLTLSNNEWQLMTVLWRADEPLIVSEIMDRLTGTVNWSYSTLQTQLTRLVDSGYLAYTKRGRTRLFYPAVPMEKCVAEENETIHSRMPEEATNQLLLCMMRDARSLTDEEADELEQLVEKLRRENQQTDGREK
ncbi:MAG: BlaI/MecI/CopY family transcriptional regulator [Clostridia bacterium]|nr:BlaI/MecI/CopY family transcriptional regulator [Clostridia bacterium]